MTLAKSGLWISAGFLVKNYLTSLISPLVFKTGDAASKEYKLNTLAKWIGVLLIIMGVLVALTAIMTLVMGARMPMSKFNFKF